MVFGGTIALSSDKLFSARSEMMKHKARKNQQRTSDDYTYKMMRKI